MPPMPGAKLPMSAAAPRVANREKQKVADMVKRRMSKYGTPGEASEIPSMPVIPDLSQLPSSLARKQQAAAKGQELDVDLDAFRDPGFNAEQCGIPPSTLSGVVNSNCTAKEDSLY